MTNWGIMGTGRIAHTFAQAVNYVSDAQLYAVASRTQEKADDFSKQYNAKVAYGSYEEMVHDENIDIIYIATPMSAHFENCKLCLENGKNVLLEKAVTMNACEFEKLIALAKEKNLFLMEAMWTKCRPTFLKAKEWAKSGLIGDVKMVKADFCNTVKLDKSDRLFAKELGGGAILDLGVYTITFACEFLGYEPKAIHCGKRIGATGVDFDAGIMLEYEDAFASMTCGFDIPCHNNATVIGTKGRIELGDWFFCTGKARLVSDEGDLIEEIDIPNLCNGYEYEIQEAQKMLFEGKKESELVPLCETLAVMKIMDYCLGK